MLGDVGKFSIKPFNSMCNAQKANPYHLARVPGPLGVDRYIGHLVPNRCPVDGPNFTPGFFVPPVTPGTMGVNDQAAAAAGAKPETKDAETKDAEKELDLLRRLYGRMKNKTGSKAYFSYNSKTKAWVYDTIEYIKDRKSFFGSTKDYKAFKTKAKADLDADKEKLRGLVDPPKAKRKKHADWKDAQVVFYTWVKKAHEKTAGAGADYAKVVKAQMSDKLKKAVATVRKDYGKGFKAGGFNPRPIKRPGGVYLLGTISEHGVGSAIDIDSGSNPQIESWRWKRILTYTGKQASSSSLAAKWKAKDPAKAKEVYDAVKAVSDAWVAKLAKAVKKLEDDAMLAAEKQAKPVAKVDHLAAVIAADTDLKKIGSTWVKKWEGGFLSLEWELVKELHEEGLRWGATFSTPDIHHFEF